VRAALIAAGADLFARRGPSAVSVRQVAEAAAVNHGLVHKYFGSKEGLLREVLASLSLAAAQQVEQFDSIGALYEDDSPARRHGRILAYLILEGRDPSELTTAFPTMQVLVDRFEAGGLSRADARQRAVEVTALVLGWQFFEPFLGAAAGLRGSPRTRDAMLSDAIMRLLR
jgi:AcrR family transcriptional regulator